MSGALTDAHLAEIRARVEAATEGMGAYASAAEELAATTSNDGAWFEADAVRGVIRDVPALLDEIARLRAVLAQAEDDTRGARANASEAWRAAAALERRGVAAIQRIAREWCDAHGNPLPTMPAAASEIADILLGLPTLATPEQP